MMTNEFVTPALCMGHPIKSGKAKGKEKVKYVKVVSEDEDLVEEHQDEEHGDENRSDSEDGGGHEYGWDNSCHFLLYSLVTGRIPCLNPLFDMAYWKRSFLSS